MKLKNQKRISSQLLKVGKTSVKFDPERLADIKEAITKEDIRGLIKDKEITKRPTSSQSKGRQKGPASKKGKKTARLSSKDIWMIKIRLQRKFIKELREKKNITERTYREMYRKTKGNFFRSKNHIKLYLTENKLFENVKK